MYVTSSASFTIHTLPVGRPSSRSSSSATPTSPLRPNAILRRRRRELVTGAVLLVLLALLPFGIKDVYTQNLVILILLYAGLSQAWNVLGGYCGQISLGHAVYFGVGGYVSTMLFVHAGVPPSLGMLAAGIVAGLAALLVREAGGFVSDYRGQDRMSERREYLAANGELHSRLHKLLAGALR